MKNIMTDIEIKIKCLELAQQQLLIDEPQLTLDKIYNVAKQHYQLLQNTFNEEQ